MGGWGRTYSRQVLEAHFARGRVAVTDRLPNFQRVYDVAERVIPAKHYRRKVDPADAERELLRHAARAHGVGTASDLADYFRMSVRDARPRLAELVEGGELAEVAVEGWRQPAYLNAKARLPRRIEAHRLLSPFDPLVWYRERVARLFGFDYRIEIWVPKGQRKFGYYVLPFLMGERFVARVDLKADRKGSCLLVLAAHLERDAKPRPVAVALAQELKTMAEWLELDSVIVARKGAFARPLAAAVRA